MKAAVRQKHKLGNVWYRVSFSPQDTGLFWCRFLLWQFFSAVSLHCFLQ